MPLHWNLTGIADHEKVCYEDRDGKKYMSPVTETLIYHTMTCGIRQITEKNAEDFFVREEISAHVFGEPLVKPVVMGDSDGNEVCKVPGQFENVKITLAEIKAHIGLHTNASNLTLAQFKKNMAEALLRNAQDELYRQKKKLEKLAEAKPV